MVSASGEFDVNFRFLGTEHFEELTDAEGTVALHITHFAQYNPNLVKEYLKDLKSSTWLPEKVITPFNLILLLSLASIDRYRDLITDSLKSCILKAFRFSQIEDKCLWLHMTFPGNFNPLTVFQKTISNCKAGWVQVYEGLVHLCFSLLESGGGLKTDTYATKESISLASNIVPMTVKKEPYLAPHVLKKLVCYVYTASNPSQYIDLLSQLVKSSPLLLIDHLSLVQDFLENLSYLNVSVATMLIHSLIPLLKMSMALKDSLMLVLRKMLYSKQIESRQIAVQGFLSFLLNFKVLGTLPSSQANMSFSSSLSQANIDVHTGLDANTNEAFCFELLGILRRVLSQQHEVKSQLYTGLYDVMRNNPKLAANILLMLHGRLSLFIDLREGILNPVLLKKVIIIQGDSVVQVEPLGRLLSCIILCTTWFENSRLDSNQNSEELEFDGTEEEEIISLLKSISTTLNTLTDRLKNADLDDLGLNKDLFSQADVSGKQAIIHAEIMVSVFDALIEYSFCSGALQSLDKMRNVASLFKAQRKVVEATTVKAPSKAGKKGNGAKGKRKGPPSKITVNFKSILGIKITCEMLKICLKAETDASENCAQLLQDNQELHIYMLHVLNQEISTLKDLVPQQRKKCIPYLKTLGALLLKECSEHLASQDPDDSREVERMRACLSAFATIITFSQKYFKEKFPNIVKELSGKSAMGELCTHLYSIYKKCQEMLKRILFHESNDKFLKDAAILIQIIGEISLQMEPGSKEIKKIQDWLHQLCKDQSIDSAPFCESLVSILFSITDRTQEKDFIPRRIARELHSNFGDIEQDISLEKEGKYKIVSDISSSPILASLLSYLECSLNITDVALYKIRAIVHSQHNGDCDIEKKISLRFAVIIQAMNEITITALPQGSVINSVIRIVTKLYTSLSLFVRYYMDLFRIKPSAKLPEEFEKMINLSCILIKNQILKLINYENDTQYKDTKKKKINVMVARVQKESRLIPTLIFNMEKYETHLVVLSKKSSVDLLVNVKLGTNRDFRIKMPVLEKLTQQDEDQQDEREETDEESGDRMEQEDESEDEAPPPKKRK